jgi:hypothetical protein
MTPSLILDQQLYSHSPLLISLREFLNKEWTRKDTCSEKAAGISRMVKDYNLRSYWVASQVFLAAGSFFAAILTSRLFFGCDMS